MWNGTSGGAVCAAVAVLLFRLRVAEAAVVRRLRRNGIHTRGVVVDNTQVVDDDGHIWVPVIAFHDQQGHCAAPGPGPSRRRGGERGPTWSPRSPRRAPPARVLRPQRSPLPSAPGRPPLGPTGETTRRRWTRTRTARACPATYCPYGTATSHRSPAATGRESGLRFPLLVCHAACPVAASTSSRMVIRCGCS